MMSPRGRPSFETPFPAFPNGRRDGPPMEADINGRMANMDLNGGQGRMRPHDPRHPNSGPRPPPARYMTEPPPLNPAQREAAARQRAAGRGGKPPQFHMGPSEDIGPGMPPPKRSVTMPTDSEPQSGAPRYPGQHTWQEPPSSPGGYSAGPPRPGTAPGSRSGPSDMPGVPPPMPQQRGPASRSLNPEHEQGSTADILDDYYGAIDQPDPDMPNFGASADASEDESFIPVDKTNSTPTSKAESGNSGGGGYTAYRPPGGVVQNMDSTEPSPSNQFAGFQFDLPDSSSNSYDHEEQFDDYGYGPSPPSRGMHSDPAFRGGYGPRGGHGPRGDYGGYAPQPPPPNPYGPPMSNRDGPRGYPDDQTGYQNMQQMPVTSSAPMEPQPPSAATNPDALPHHPVPFRPGLDQGSKPPPIRQYDNPPPAPAQSGQGGMPVPANKAPETVTHAEIQRLQQTVKANPQDHQTQLFLAKKLVEASIFLIDDNGRTDMKTRNKSRERYIFDAHKMVKKLVSAGYPPAMFYLADCYGQGWLGLQPDPREAFSLYQSAAKGGHPESAYRLAVCCEMGNEGGGGTKRDPIKAVQWYRRAAALGDTPAMYKMGIILLKGLLGQPRNPREAVSWLKRAAERADEDNPHALHELALLYENPGPNDTIIKDEEYSCQLLHQAADFGYKFSQHRLGAAYEYGLLGCPVDPRQSIIWYTRAAAQGEHQSELSLSGWYLTGSEGILQQNDTEAYLWARKAASAGLAKAEYAMGYFSEVGIGIPANLEDAKRWYWKASCKSSQSKQPFVSFMSGVRICVVLIKSANSPKFLESA